jgi:hypothetical protein
MSGARRALPQESGPRSLDGKGRERAYSPALPKPITFTACLAPTRGDNSQP